MANDVINDLNVNSDDITLGEIKKLIGGYSLDFDPSNLSEEELKKVACDIVLISQKLKPFEAVINSINGVLHFVDSRFQEERLNRSALFRVADDGTGEVFFTGSDVKTVTTIDGAELAKRAGLDDSVHVTDPNFAKFYPTKARPRYNRSAVLADPELSQDPAIVRKVSYEQGTFIKIETKKGGE